MLHLHFVCVLDRVNNSCRVASREPVNTSQIVSSICDREVGSTDSDHSSIIPIGNKGNNKSFFLLQLFCISKQKYTQSYTHTDPVLFVIYLPADSV